MIDRKTHPQWKRYTKEELAELPRDYRRQIAESECKEYIFEVMRKLNLSSNEVDVVLLEVAKYLIWSATSLQRTAVLCEDLGMAPKEAIEELRRADPSPDEFRGSREI
jgi:hypothetical protein